MNSGLRTKDLVKRGTEKKRVKLGLVCTSGGHFEQMLGLAPLYERYPRFWITSPGPQSTHTAKSDTKYLLKMAHFKKPWQYLIHLPKVIWAFVAERPTCLLSTGSGRLGLVPFLIARLTGVKFIHIETVSHVHRLTKMGRIVRFFGQPVYSQWESPSENVIYLGPIINNSINVELGNSRQDHIFVTAGTRYEPFPRLLKAVEDLKRRGVIKQRVIVQAGYTKYDSEFMEIFAFCPPQEIDRLIAGALFVITQESAGIATKCLKSSTRFLVLPRSFSQGELPARSDMNEDLHLRLAEMGFTEVVHTSEEMEAAIGRIDKLKTGFPFDNSRALTVLRSLIDNDT